MGGAEEEFHLAHILVVIPEQASAEKSNCTRQGGAGVEPVEGRRGFAQVAAGYSDAKDALKGGDLGWRLRPPAAAIYR
jgi:peptidyl-prolyl cis-trans isomerase SurA